MNLGEFVSRRTRIKGLKVRKADQIRFMSRIAYKHEGTCGDRKNWNNSRWHIIEIHAFPLLVQIIYTRRLVLKTIPQKRVYGSLVNCSLLTKVMFGSIYDESERSGYKSFAFEEDGFG